MFSVSPEKNEKRINAADERTRSFVIFFFCCVGVVFLNLAPFIVSFNVAVIHEFSALGAFVAGTGNV